ncbi:MAG: HD domain-containing protein [Candidatus Peribacteraceae bacterium]|nr:HD domain-containing protein [Candidatus Peribacteraceae bacterium]
MQWNEFRTHIRHLSAADQERVRSAFGLGMELHRNQLRKSGAPYFTHPLATADMLADMGADADSLIAALLHDTIEDTPFTVEDVRAQFGPIVADLIDGVTKLMPEDVSGHPTLDDRIETLRKIFTLLKKDVRIVVLKLVDRLHNMQTVEFVSPERQEALARETCEVYVKIADRLCMQELRDELEEYCLSVLEPELLQQLKALRKQNEPQGKKIAKEMQRALAKIAPHDLPVETLFEQKAWETLREQTTIGGIAATGLSTHTVVFLTNSSDECYRMLGLLHDLWQQEMLSFEDFINHPQINGYQGLHTTVILEDGTRVRCKIRTHEMHTYARKGIATKCFDSESAGLVTYLPWTEHISTLSKDSEDRSEQFWESLKSDILRESITIHGPNDIVKLLPTGTTALDAIFYLFEEKGLTTQDVFINGTKVPFYEGLSNGCSVSATFADEPQVELSWLQNVQTGIAAAFIRQGLAQVPENQKILLGKNLLEHAVRAYAKVEWSELETASLLQHLSALGISSFETLYEQIAEGKIQAERAARSLFPEHKSRKPLSEKRRWNLSVRFPTALTDVVNKATRVGVPRSLSFRHLNGDCQITADYNLSAEQSQEMQTLLRTILPDERWSLVPRTALCISIAAAFILIILWGLDPVFAHLLLWNSTISPPDLTFIRFVTLFIATTILYGLQSRFTKQKLKPLSPRHPALVTSALALFLTAFCSYLALELISPTQYILFIIEGLIVIVLLRSIAMRTTRWWKLHISFLLLTLGITLLIVMQGTSPLGLLYAAVSSLGFALYSEVSARYQRGTIHARYPAFLFWLSIIGMPFVLLLLPFTTLRILPAGDLLRSILFAIVFSVLPYGLYYESMRRMKSDLLDRALPFVCLSTIIGEAISTQSFTPFIATPLLVVFLWYYSAATRS